MNVYACNLMCCSLNGYACMGSYLCDDSSFTANTGSGSILLVAASSISGLACSLSQ